MASGWFSFAAGYNASALHDGSFVWSCNSNTFASTGDSQFLTDASGGVGIVTNNPRGYQLLVYGTAAKPGGGSWSNFSDGRLKTLGGNYQRGLPEVTKLNPVRYRYRENNELGLPADEEFVGLVAQEVEGIIPEAVEANSDGYLMVNNDPIIWTMVNAIKELKGENQELRDRNREMKRRLEALERQMEQFQLALAKEVQ